MKIKHTIYIILLLFTVIPLSGFGVFMIYNNNINIEKTMEENLKVTSGAQILDIENFCRNKSEGMEEICQLDLIHSALRASLENGAPLPDKEYSYLNNILNSRVVSNDYTESLSIIDTNFRVVASNFNCNYGITSKLKEANPQYLSGEFQFTNVLMSDGSGTEQPAVIAIMGIYDQGILSGYVVEEINMVFFDNLRTETDLWEDGTLYLLDGNGKIITAGDGTEESRQQLVLSKKEREDYMSKWDNIDFEEHPTGKIKYKALGQDYITYYSDIQYSDWKILLSINLSNFQKEKSAYAVLIFTTLVAVISLLIIINYFISNKLTKPVQDIIDTLRNIQEHEDYTLRIHNEGQDEIGILSSEINVLLEYVETENLIEQERREELAFIANHDSLTKLYNRKAIEKLLTCMLKDAGETGKTIAVALVDIDDFKDFNTKFGHQGGDRVLKFVASTIDGMENCTVGRIGGDEFILGIEEISDIHKLERMIEHLLYKLNHNFFDGKSEKTIPISCSIGLAVIKGKPCEYKTAFGKADAAMYTAKEQGKNTYRMTIL